MSGKKYTVLRSRRCKNRLLGILFAFVTLLFSGCAGRLPATLPLNVAQQQDAETLLKMIRQRNCPDFLDADVTMSWQGYGQSRHLKATLQATVDGELRLNILDPLGRAFIILASDGARFFLVDNQKGRGYTGAVDSVFLAEYIPAGFQFSSVFSFLAARLPAVEYPLIRLAASRDGNAYWYIFAGENETRYHVEVDPDHGLPLRQFILNGEGDIVLDVHYQSYQQQNECPYPTSIMAEGQGVSGSLQLLFDTFYPEAPPVEIFHLQVPTHFTVQPVE